VYFDMSHEQRGAIFPEGLGKELELQQRRQLRGKPYFTLPVGHLLGPDERLRLLRQIPPCDEWPAWLCMWLTAFEWVVLMEDNDPARRSAALEEMPSSERVLLGDELTPAERDQFLNGEEPPQKEVKEEELTAVRMSVTSLCSMCPVLSAYPCGVYRASCYSNDWHSSRLQYMLMIHSPR
jgi:hypothetical protein